MKKHILLKKTFFYDDRAHTCMTLYTENQLAKSKEELQR